VKPASTRLTGPIGALLLSAALAGAPALTHAHSLGGGGGHFSGGGHVSGGHVGGGGHFGGGGHVGGGHLAGGGHFMGGGHAPSGHFAAAPPALGGHMLPRPVVGPHSAGVAAHLYHTPARGGFNSVSTMHAWTAPRFWGGGYWNGAFWPRVYFNVGFAWFLPVIPYGYATYWWGGVPYYYWNDLYYTWSPYDNGYVVTDPPPVAGTDSDAPAAGYESAAGSADVYIYPRNGQSDEQTQTDRYECHSWAAGQSGYDPTRPAQQPSGRAGYRRAMVACLEARGYSAR
jgi:hypothetical protein